MVSKNSTTVNRAKVQSLINSNTARAVGDFHTDELDVDSFILDMKNTFNLSSKNGEDPNELLYQTIEKSKKKIRGRMNAKEFNQKKFLNMLFENFELEML